MTADGTPKLLDFGIAKLLRRRGAARRRRRSTRLRGMTPEYASPEQVRGEPVTTASDVYSLGVLLYELLTGRSPTASRRWTPRSSSASSASATRSGRARARAGLSGDLDAIVMKAMRKEPERRYGSADAAVRRHAALPRGRPVLARKDSLAYRAGKFIRRHRIAVAAAALVALVLAGGVFATLRESRRARTPRRAAERRFDDVRKLSRTRSSSSSTTRSADLPGSTRPRPGREARARVPGQALAGIGRGTARSTRARGGLPEGRRRAGQPVPRTSAT